MRQLVVTQPKYFTLAIVSCRVKRDCCARTTVYTGLQPLPTIIPVWHKYRMWSATLPERRCGGCEAPCLATEVWRMRWQGGPLCPRAHPLEQAGKLSCSLLWLKCSSAVVLVILACKPTINSAVGRREWWVVDGHGRRMCATSVLRQLAGACISAAMAAEIITISCACGHNSNR